MQSSLKAIESLRDDIRTLLQRLKRLKSGEQLLPYMYDSRDDLYETQCPGCKKFTGGGYRNLNEIPFVKDCTNGGKCFECAKSPEQKAEEARKFREKTEAAERAMLASLQQKYGNTR